VAHVDHPGGTAVTDQMACWFDGPLGDRPGAYGMPTPGIGYKIGLDVALRDWSPDDLDRTPDDALLAQLAERVREDLPALVAAPFDAQVCSWTESPDNRFVIDRRADGIVLACGDGGEGFKFSALMGEVLADLAEGGTADSDVASFGLARFDGGLPDQQHVLGR
jgi:sarcosine oxidase